MLDTSTSNFTGPIDGNDADPSSGIVPEDPLTRAARSCPAAVCGLTQGPKVALATARFRTIVKRLSSASARPTEIPQLRAAAALPTGFPQTKRHSPAHVGTPAMVAL